MRAGEETGGGKTGVFADARTMAACEELLLPLPSPPPCCMMAAREALLVRGSKPTAPSPPPGQPGGRGGGKNPKPKTLPGSGV